MRTINTEKTYIPLFTSVEIGAGQLDATLLDDIHAGRIGVKTEIILEPCKVAASRAIGVEVLIIENVDGEGPLILAPQIRQENKELPVVDADFRDIAQAVVHLLPFAEGNNGGNGTFIEPAGHGPIQPVLKHIASDARRVQISLQAAG